MLTRICGFLAALILALLAPLLHDGIARGQPVMLVVEYNILSDQIGTISGGSPTRPGCNESAPAVGLYVTQGNTLISTSAGALPA